MKEIRLFLLISLVVLIIWLITPVITYFLYPQLMDRGQFGDLFGSVNALFSGLAFSGLIYTIFLQKQEIAKLESAQRETEKLLRAQVLSAEHSTKLSAIKILYDYYYTLRMNMPSNIHSTSVSFVAENLEEKIDRLSRAADEAYQELILTK